MLSYMGIHEYKVGGGLWSVAARILQTANEGYDSAIAVIGLGL